jgi:hypothetical protein
MKTLKTASEREAFIGWHLKTAMEKLGYREVAAVPRRADRVWCFSRQGEQFVTEMICVELRWRPRRSVGVDFYGSMKTPEYLAQNGLTRNAGGFNLHYFQVDHLDRDNDSVLPPEIALGDEAGWRGLFERLSSEIAATDQNVWPALWDAWRATMQMQGTPV